LSGFIDDIKQMDYEVVIASELLNLKHDRYFDSDGLKNPELVSRSKCRAKIFKINKK
jgi:hypothetical protein